MPWLGLAVLLYILRQKERRGFARRSTAVVIVYLLFLASCTGLFLYNGVEEETDAQLFSAIGGTSEELEAFYANLEIEPVKDGQKIHVEAKALTEEDLDVLRTAKLYVDGEQYQFVYVTSK